MTIRQFVPWTESDDSPIGQLILSALRSFHSIFFFFSLFAHSRNKFVYLPPQRFFFFHGLVWLTTSGSRNFRKKFWHYRSDAYIFFQACSIRDMGWKKKERREKKEIKNGRTSLLFSMSIVPISIFITAVFFSFLLSAGIHGWLRKQRDNSRGNRDGNKGTRQREVTTKQKALNAKETERKKATLTNHRHFFLSLSLSLSLSLCRLYKNSLTKISFGGDCFATRESSWNVLAISNTGDPASVLISMLREILPRLFCKLRSSAPGSIQSILGRETREEAWIIFRLNFDPLNRRVSRGRERRIWRIGSDDKEKKTK